MRKIKCILLVDDDSTTNFLNEELIDDLKIADHVHVALNGQEALDYINLEGKFESKKRSTHPLPSLIFLDINMPIMDGFEFLNHYKHLPADKKKSVLVVFLTTSDAVQDKLASYENKFIIDFINKPLRKNRLLKIRDSYLENYES